MTKEKKTQGQVGQNTRSIIIRGLKRLHKIRKEKEEEVATELLEEVQDRKQQLEDVWKEIEDYLASWETQRRRSCITNMKIWKLAQSSATKSRLGWAEGKNPSRCWLEQDDGHGS